jgi:hypothetical protein
MHFLKRLPTDRGFTLSQAIAWGVSRHHLRALVAQGLVRPLFRGLYAVSSLELSIECRARAVSLVIPGSAVATDETAAWLHGIDVLPGHAPDELPRLSFFQQGAHERLRNQATSSGSRQLAVTDVERVHGVLVTTPLRTAVDLARLRRPDRALGALDGFLRLRVFTVDDMVRELERFKGYRGIIRARVLVPLADARSESPAESKLRYAWLTASDLPRPQLQVPVVHPFSSEPWRLDLAVEDLKYAAEYDGEQFHGTREQQERDRRRRTYLREEDDWTIDVFTKADVYARNAHPAAIIREGIRTARLNQGRPRREWRWPA